MNCHVAAKPAACETFYSFSHWCCAGDADLQFAGQTAHYSHVPFQRVTQGKEVHITGTVPSTCSDFKIERPTFLTVPIKNEIPVKVDMTWAQQQLRLRGEAGGFGGLIEFVGLDAGVNHESDAEGGRANMPGLR
jgi:hypothetical protein